MGRSLFIMHVVLALLAFGLGVWTETSVAFLFTEIEMKGSHVPSSSFSLDISSYPSTVLASPSSGIPLILLRYPTCGLAPPLSHTSANTNLLCSLAHPSCHCLFRGHPVRMRPHYDILNQETHSNAGPSGGHV